MAIKTKTQKYHSLIHVLNRERAGRIIKLSSGYVSKSESPYLLYDEFLILNM
jgi:hypothetical protein